MRSWEVTHQLRSLHKLFPTQYNECLTPTDRAHACKMLGDLVYSYPHSDVALTNSNLTHSLSKIVIHFIHIWCTYFG